MFLETELQGNRFTSFEDWRIRTRMKIFLLEDELSQQIRVEKHIAEIAKELEIKLEVISTGKISEFENYIQHSDIHQLYFLDIHIQDNEYCGLEIAQKYEKQILMPLLFYYYKIRIRFDYLSL